MSLTSPPTGAQTYWPSPQVPFWQISSSSLEISGFSSWSEVKQANHPASITISLSTTPLSTTATAVPPPLADW